MGALLLVALVASVCALAWLWARERARVRDLAAMAELLRAHGRRPAARVRVTSSDREVRALAAAINDHLDEDRERDLARRELDARFHEELAALSHDLRTPLAGAMGFLQLARRTDDDERAAGYLASADERLGAMRALVDGLLSYARATDPSFSPELGAVSLGEVVARVMAAHYAEFLARGWEPVVEGSGGAAVLAHEGSLERVVENLVVNALEHGCDAPRVLVGDAELVVENPLTEADAKALDPERLMSRFYQADSARAGQGAGLGLSVASALATAMGARLSVGVEPGPLFVARLTLVPADQADESARQG